MSKKTEEKEEFNIFEHKIVPKHILLSEDETESLLKKYGIKPFQLPKIKDSDPAVKALNAKPGDVIKILRKSPTAGLAEYYRCVFKG